MPKSSIDAKNANEPHSFTRTFPPELRAEIVSYLVGRDLKSYSLACHAFHTDATRYLWRGAEVRWSHRNAPSHKDPDEFFSLMANCPERARRIKALSIYYLQNTPPKTKVGSRFANALSLMNGVQRLDIVVYASLRKGVGHTQSAPEGLYNAFERAAFKATLSHLSINTPADLRGFDQLVRLFPNLRTLVCCDTSDDLKIYQSPDPSSLQHLQHAYGQLNLLEVLPGRAKVETFKLLQSRRLYISLEVTKVGDAARRVQSLKHLSFDAHTRHRTDYTDDSPRLLSKVAHPNLVSLTVGLDHEYAKRESYLPAHVVLSPTFIFGVLSTDALTHVPSLRYLHISHRNDFVLRAVLKNPPQPRASVKLDSNYELDEDKIQLGLEALEKCLAAESRYPHSLQELWIDCSVADLLPTVLSPRLRFSAKRGGGSGVDWSVQAKMVWCSEAVDGQLGADFRYPRRFSERHI